MEFGLALLSEVPAQDQTTAARSWTSLQASATGAAFVGVDGLQVSADTITIEINRASTEAGAVVDYGWKNPDNQALGRNTALSVATGPDSDIEPDHGRRARPAAARLGQPGWTSSASSRSAAVLRSRAATTASSSTTG